MDCLRIGPWRITACLFPYGTIFHKENWDWWFTGTLLAQPTSSKGNFFSKDYSGCGRVCGSALFYRRGEALGVNTDFEVGKK